MVLMRPILYRFAAAAAVQNDIFWEALYAGVGPAWTSLRTYKLCAWKASVAEQTNKKTNKTSNTRRDVRVGFHVG